MSQKDKRPDAGDTLAGLSNQGVTMPCGEDNTTWSADRQAKFGNNCGHFPLQPRLYASVVKRPLPIYRAIQNANEYYWQPNNYLQDLQDIRKKRSERREGIAAVVQVILDYTDLATMTVGIPTKHDMDYLTLRFIAKKAQINIRRVYRAMVCLMKAGYIEIERRYERVGESSYKGLAAIRKVSSKLFTHLGVKYEILSLSLGWLRKRAEVKNIPRKFTGKLKQLGSFLNKTAKTVTNKVSEAQRAATLKARSDRMYDLFKQGFSMEEIKKLVGPPA